MASERGKRYIDLFSPIQALGKQVTLTDNGIHLNEAGYYHLATTLEKSLGLAPRFEPVTDTGFQKQAVGFRAGQFTEQRE